MLAAGASVKVHVYGSAASNARKCCAKVSELSITDDGGGIRNLSQAMTFNDSTNLVRNNHEIGQYGKGLKVATWHIGDDCFIMTV